MLSTLLYQKRFFPFYTFNIIAGLDSNGNGAVFSFDPIGSFERESMRSYGSGASLVQPFLDLAKSSNDELRQSEQMIVNLVKNAFVSAAERDIYTGDQVDIVTISKSGISRDLLKVRND